MENKQKNPRRRLNSLILLVAFTAIMLIVSTYAWFSAQKNVTISGLEGKVNVAEGLMVSLDAKNWSQSIELDDTNVTKYLDNGRTLLDPYDTTTADGAENMKSSELVPVSTTGNEGFTTKDELTFYRGVNVYTDELHTIQETVATVTDPTDNTFPGYHAIDLFFQNSSKLNQDLDGDGITGEEDDAEIQGEAEETLQLNTNSLLQLVTGGSEATGLQNTTRVALALYGYTEDGSTDVLEDRTASVHITATQPQILNAYASGKITDVAIWEPNASDHVDYVVTNNNTITWNADVKSLYITNDIMDPGDPDTVLVEAASRDNKFLATEMIPTYALTAASKSAQETLTDTEKDGVKGIADIYNWSAENTAVITGSGVQRQIALQTKKSSGDYTTIDGGVRNLVSVTSSGEAIYEEGTETGVVEFKIKKNQIAKVRLYIWLEGQDVDTINYASHGGGVHLDLGLVKGQVTGPQGS